MRPWLLWTFFAVFCWGLWAVIAKLIGDSISAAQSQALSTLGIAPVMLALLRATRLAAHPSSNQETGALRSLPWRGMLLGFAAGIFTCLGNIAYYYALNNAKALAVIPLTALYPLVTVLLGVVFLRERLNAIQMAGAAQSFVAIYLFNAPGADGVISPWLLAACIPILLWGVSGFTQKLSTQYISAELSTLCFLAAFIPIALAILAVDWPKSVVPARVFLLAALLGLTFALGNLGILKAFEREGKASVIAPIGGLYPVVSIPIAILWLKEQAGPREIAGIMIACAAIAALARESPPTEKRRPAEATV